MSVKSKLLEEIDKKANRIKEHRKSSANNGIEKHVFEFFKNMDDVNRMTCTSEDHRDLSHIAINGLFNKSRTIDPLCDVEVNWDGHLAQGVTVYWSIEYQTRYQVAPELYIDVTEILLLEL